MKAITVCQPYAYLIGTEKPIENRNWWTSYRGPLVIHAGKSKAWMDDAPAYGLTEAGLVFGACVVLCDLVACLAIDSKWPDRYLELQDNRHANGPFCLLLENRRRLAEPIQWRGAQGLWDVPPELARLLSLAKVA